jgi:hypothetical protein
MRRLGLVLACLVAVFVPLLLGAEAGLAASSNGCPGSAGDSQYVDPLGCPQTTSKPTSPPPTNASSPPSTTTTPQVTVASTTTTTSSQSTGQDPPGSLPRTGLDVPAAILLGVLLLAAGVAVRRSVSSGG